MNKVDYFYVAIKALLFTGSVNEFLDNRNRENPPSANKLISEMPTQKDDYKLCHGRKGRQDTILKITVYINIYI